MSQKWIGGLWVNGWPPSVGKKKAPLARISRMTWAYLVSSPTKRSRRNGVISAAREATKTAASTARRESMREGIVEGYNRASEPVHRRRKNLMSNRTADIQRVLS